MWKYAGFLSVLCIVSTSAAAQVPSKPSSETQSMKELLKSRSSDIEANAAKAREEQDQLNRRVAKTARKAIDSMCVECLGARYNQPGPRTPVILPDALSEMTGEAPMEGEP